MVKTEKKLKHTPKELFIFWKEFGNSRDTLKSKVRKLTLFYHGPGNTHCKKLEFSFQPGVENKNWENEVEICKDVAYIYH